jgi:coenzyme F420-0:L-glutamate ligase/coenzyme F420-1:gamma-L-glutamate ligase
LIGGEIRLIPLVGVPEVAAGDDLVALFVNALAPESLEDRDVLVVTQKVVSKAEGRTLPVDQKQAAILSESKRILRRTSGGMVISETHHGFVCANAGVDESNVDQGHIVLLPVDPDASARKMRARLKHATGKDVAVVVSDTFGRAWRMGQTDVAIGVAGIDPFIDYRGSRDTQQRELTATRIAIVDELAGAAELVMGKAEGICAAVVRGAHVVSGRGSARELVRDPGDDLFR